MKMVMFTYNIAFHGELLETLAEFGLKEYTCLEKAIGVGKTGGPHLNNEVWPVENSVLFVAMEDKTAKELLNKIRELRKTKSGKEGLKAFSWTIDELT